MTDFPANWILHITKTVYGEMFTCKAGLQNVQIFESSSSVSLMLHDVSTFRCCIRQKSIHNQSKSVDD